MEPAEEGRTHAHKAASCHTHSAREGAFCQLVVVWLWCVWVLPRWPPFYVNSTVRQSQSPAPSPTVCFPTHRQPRRIQQAQCTMSSERDMVCVGARICGCECGVALRRAPLALARNDNLDAAVLIHGVSGLRHIPQHQEVRVYHQIAPILIPWAPCPMCVYVWCVGIYAGKGRKLLSHFSRRIGAQRHSCVR